MHSVVGLQWRMLPSLPPWGVSTWPLSGQWEIPIWEVHWRAGHMWNKGGGMTTRCPLPTFTAVTYILVDITVVEPSIPRQTVANGHLAGPLGRLYGESTEKWLFLIILDHYDHPVNIQLDPENHQFWMETNLPTISNPYLAGSMWIYWRAIIINHWLYLCLLVNHQLWSHSQPW